MRRLVGHPAFVLVVAAALASVGWLIINIHAENEALKEKEQRDKVIEAEGAKGRRIQEVARDVLGGD